MSPGLGQVPSKPDLTYGIVGSGRVARHFTHFFSLLGRALDRPIQTFHWTRHNKESITRSLQSCDVLLFLVSDPAIEDLAKFFPDHPKKRRFHFSGSLVTPHALGAHPLMTFGPELYELDEYQRIPFVTEDRNAFHEAFPQLPNPCFSIRPEDKARYHALCAMAGNFTGFLWAKLLQDLPGRLGIPAEAAIPYLERVSRNLTSNPTEPERFFTGPIARHDIKTVGRNLDALSGDPYQAVYRAFAEMMMPELSTKEKTESTYA